MENSDFLATKVLDPITADVLCILTSSLQDKSTLLHTINAIANDFSRYIVTTPNSDTNANLKRLRLVLKIKHYLESNSTGRDNKQNRADKDVFGEALARKCIESLHGLETAGLEDASQLATTTCDILGLTLLLLPCSQYEKTLRNLINHCEFNISSFGTNVRANDDGKLVGTRTMINLKILETFIEVSTIIKRETLVTEKLEENVVDSKETHSFLLDLISNGERIVAAQTLLAVVPKLITLADNNELVSKIWSRISQFSGFATVVELPRVILALVSLADYFLPETLSALCLPLPAEPKFWPIVALGLSSEDALLRKQALFLAKRASDADSGGPVAGGDGTQRRALWSRLFVVLETLEEKQPHLALPVLPLVERLLSTDQATACLRNDYVLVVFHRLLNHDHAAVVKWGALRLLRCDSDVFCGQEAETDTGAVFRAVAAALNNAFMFAPGPDDHPPSAVAALAALASRLPGCATSQLLAALAARPWNPCALFHVARALAMADARPIWAAADVEAVCALASTALATSGERVRDATQRCLLAALVNQSDLAGLTLVPALGVLGAFRAGSVLAPGSKSRALAVTWLRQVADAGEASAYVASAMDGLLGNGEDAGALSAGPLARALVLLLDAGLVDPALAPVRAGLRRALADAGARPYASAGKQEAALELLAGMLADAPADDGVRALCRESAHDAVAAVARRLSQVAELGQFPAAAAAADVVATLLPCAHRDDLEKLTETALSVLTQASAPAVRQYLALRLLVTLAPPPTRYAGLLLAGEINGGPARGGGAATRDVATLHGRLVSGMLVARWTLLCCQIGATPPPPGDLAARFGDVVECLQVGGGGGKIVSWVALALASLLPRAEPAHRDAALAALAACWAAALELRGADTFWPALAQVVAAAFQAGTVGQRWIQPQLTQMALSLLSLAQGVVGLANVLMSRLLAVADADALLAMDTVVVEGLLFGPLHRKDQRFEEETLAAIKSFESGGSDEDLAEPPSGADVKARAASVSLLLRATSTSAGAWRGEAASHFALSLTRRHDELTRRNPRYYADSAQHRMRHRALQGLLLIAGGVDQGTATAVLAWSWRSLASSSHQRSVRCQLEWLAARLTLAIGGNVVGVPGPGSDPLQQERGPAQDPQQDTGPALACSVLVVAALVARSRRSEGNLRAGMELALAALAAQHFNLRLHALVVFRSLWSAAEDAGFTSLLARFAAVDAALTTQPAVAGGNAARNAERMQHDFFLTQLDALAHVSVGSVCRDLPRLTGLASTNELLAAADVGDGGAVPLRCGDPRMELAAAAQCTPRDDANPEDAVPPAADPERERGSDVDVQRKPTAPGGPDAAAPPSRVVLVASLVDKPANLGGLCRSCAVFDARLVVPRAALTQDKAFLALSVSSQRWVPIEEVGPRELRKYLSAMKQQGYTLVGAEQTAGSVTIQDMRFPRKTLLLLGNEKEGVPADLLPLLDACVEIPQQGVIRSLNVHVTAAIFLWEISRQHHLGR